MSASPYVLRSTACFKALPLEAEGGSQPLNAEKLQGTEAGAAPWMSVLSQVTSPVPTRENPDALWGSEGTPRAPPAPAPPRKGPAGGWLRMVLTALNVFLTVDALLNLIGGATSTSVPTPGSPWS